MPRPTERLEILTKQGFFYHHSYPTAERAKEDAWYWRSVGYSTRIVDTGSLYELWLKQKKEKSKKK